MDPLNFLGEEKSEENGVWILTDVEHVSDLLHGSENALLLVALYSPTCPFSTTLVQKLEETAASLSVYFKSLVQSTDTDTDTDIVTVLPPKIAKLDSSRVDPSWIETLGIDSYPSLFFFRQVKDETVAMEYLGLKEEPSDIVETILHYWYRHAWGPIFPTKDFVELQAFIHKNGAGLLRHIPPPLNPDYTDTEQATITWLMDSDEDQPDHYILIVECQASPTKSFSDLAKTISTQRDVALFSSADCADVGNDGDVLSIFVNPHSWQLGEAYRKPPEMSLNEYAVQHTTPSVLFYDRISTGPIAFATHRKIHAVLFVRLSNDEASRRAIRSFRRTCQELHTHREEDMVCMVVPETETRILMYFGIDIWTPLDVKVSHGTPVPEVLPVLLITDQRNDQFRRYYLDASELVKDESTSTITMHKFMSDFWNNSLTPELKSSSRPARKNSHGVEIISGRDFSRVVLERRDRHTLLYLHAPTCGHCKRFSIVWNELARMVLSVKWNSFLDVVQMDATENEIVELDIDPAFLPAVYYLPASASGGNKNNDNVVQFDVRDKLGESVGRLRDPADILDWMLDQGYFDEKKLMQTIEEVEREEKKGEKGMHSKKEGAKPEAAKA